MGRRPLLPARFSWRIRPKVDWPAQRGHSPAEVTYAAVALAIACCLFFHGYEIFNFTLSIDEEVNLGGEDLFTYLQHGRWGLALRVLLLMPDTTVPIAAIATGLALYGTAFVFLIRQYRIQHWGAVAVAAPLYFGFPCPSLRHCLLKYRALPRHRHCRCRARPCRRRHDPPAAIRRGGALGRLRRLALSIVTLFRHRDFRRRPDQSPLVEREGARRGGVRRSFGTAQSLPAASRSTP